MRESTLPRHEELWLLEHVTGRSRSDLLQGVELSRSDAAHLAALTDRRLAGEPIQYLIGSVAFGPIELVIDRRVLIPRPETEQLWERVIGRLGDERSTVVDVGTGSGCLALAIADERPGDRVIATDISPDAVEVATANAARLGLDVEILTGDLFDPLSPSIAGVVDVIVSNPPYISAEDHQRLAPEIRDHEPPLALVAADGGLAVVARLLAEAGQWLRRDGYIFIEIGEGQGRRVQDLAESHGWSARIEQDHADRDRFLIAWGHE